MVCFGFVHYNLTWRNLMEGSPSGPTVKYGNSSGRGIYEGNKMLLTLNSI